MSSKPGKAKAGSAGKAAVNHPAQKAVPIPADDDAGIDDDDALNDVRAQQQMIESIVDNSGEFTRIEKEKSLERDDPDNLLDDVDPVPPKGN